MGRLQLYVAGSAVMANIVLMRAYIERPNFYSAAVYISQSTGSLMFLVNLMLIVAASVGYGLQRLFYGSLRPIETEQLYDKAWFAVSETLLAMTIFRDDIGMWFFTMFLCLLAGKVWQWIGEGRVEFLEQQPPANPKLFHTRLMSSLLLSVAFDIFMMQYCIDSILSEARPGVMVMFGFEYVLLAIASISTLLRYTLSLIELYITHRQEKAREEARGVTGEQARQRAAAEGAETPAPAEDDEDEGDVPGWEEKGRWVFYLDLATDFIKSVVYLGFFMILMTFYGIPIHIMRDLFMTIRSLIKRINDFIQYRNATRDMHTRYPDATAEELERENTCIVCREEMRPWVQPGADGAQPGRRMDERQRPKKLPCGHILHFGCLRSWLERQQVCPTCRRPVLGSAATQNTHGNNQANQGLPNPQIRVRDLFRANAQQDAGGQQHGQGQQPAAQGGQPNPPAGNMRVFNFGPFRIALGNLRVQPGQQDNAVVQNAMNQLRQQAIANNAAMNPGQQNQTNTQIPFTQGAALNLLTGPLPGAVALHPSDVQSDILRIQHNIIESMRQLNAQHAQLEVVHSLLTELNRLQRVSGVTAELPPIASLNPPNMNSFVPQAYFARGSVLRQGDAGVPEGLTLPEGWTLRPMALAPRPGQESNPTLPSSQPAQAEHEGSSTSPPLQPAQPAAEPNTQAGPSTSTVATSQVQPASSSIDVTSSGQLSSSSPKPAEPSSLDSSWSFSSNVAERNAAEGSSSAVAGSRPEGQTAPKRTVTVEDAEDDER
ncbi:RING finger domain-containing protein [Clathrospora elynae]|uniref:RING-type E3 ubiquitin transferase n=1 Tax=Clathrospora elynae TaxID=706981 RepID=A0A6A5S8A3_9PLEO|nr:RING finger domain-containing protein [Clathrospora elynae]